MKQHTCNVGFDSLLGPQFNNIGIVKMFDGDQGKRKTVPISHEEFSLADAAGRWVRREVVESMTVLHYPKMSLLCSAFGCCAVTAVPDPMALAVAMSAVA